MTGNWNRQTYFKAFNPESNDQFGRSIAVSENMIAISAWKEDGGSPGVNGDMWDNSSLDSGAVYVYLKDVFGAWHPYAYLKRNPVQAGELFGTNMSFQGSSLFIWRFYSSDGTKGYYEFW